MSSVQNVLAICVNWNGEEVLEGTIRSLLASNYPALKVVVVDNNSKAPPDRQLPPEVEVIYLEENRGYGGAINAALQARVYSPEGRHPGFEPEFVLILNNDLWIPADAVTALLRVSEEEGAGIVGPRIIQASNPMRLEAAWGEISWSHVLVRLRGKNAEKTDPEWLERRNVEMLLGSFLLIRREVFDKIGLFDPLFFMYHEEVDFQYRARKQGFSLLYCPSTEILHLGGYSTRNRSELKTFWIRRNTLLFLRKHHAPLPAWCKFWTTLGLSLLFNALLLRVKRLKAILKGVSEGISVRVPHE